MGQLLSFQTGRPIKAPIVYVYLQSEHLTGVYSPLEYQDIRSTMDAIDLGTHIAITIDENTANELKEVIDFTYHIKSF